MQESLAYGELGYKYTAIGLPYDYTYKSFQPTAEGGLSQTFTLSDWHNDVEIYINYE